MGGNTRCLHDEFLPNWSYDIGTTEKQIRYDMGFSFFLSLIKEMFSLLFRSFGPYFLIKTLSFSFYVSIRVFAADWQHLQVLSY